MSKSKISSDSSRPKQGLLIILSAPSGCGKTTLVDRLLKRHPDWMRSISATTRSPRLGEKEGEDYFFVPPSSFDEMEAKQGFLESARIFNQAYGTPKDFILKQLQEGKKIVLAIDIQGMKKIKKSLNGKVSMITIFVLPPSVKILRERLEGRKTESPEEIQRRIENAQDEIKAANLYDYTVVNQNLEQTVLEIEELIEKFQKERGENANAIRFS